MNRIFLTSEIDDIISTDREIIKSVLALIDDIKKIASESTSDAARVSSEAKKGDVSGAAATIRSSIDNEAYSNAKSKLTCVENNIKGIKLMDQTFAKELAKLSQCTDKIKGIIKELDDFLRNTPLTTPAADYNAALSAKMVVWEKVLENVDSEVEEVKKMAKGAEIFSSIFSSDPVNLSTGNFIYEKTDLEYGGSQGLRFKRFYNSVNDYEGILGKDWITNYEVKLTFVDSKVFDKKEISIIKEDGKEELFLPVDDKRYTPQANSLADLFETENGYEYKTIEGNRYIFDKEGILQRYENNNGLGYSLEYFCPESVEKSNESIEKEEIVKKKSVLQKVTKDTGECFVFACSENGYLKSVTDSEGRKVIYEVRDGKLLTVTRPDGTSAKYTYSVSGKLRGIENNNSVISVENEYDQEFRVTKQCFPDGTAMSYEYDDENNIVTQTERNGAVTVHYHDEKFRNIRNVYPDGEESFVYNSKGLKIQINDKNGNISRMSYDNRGNITSIINPLGDKLSVTYNSFNKPLVISVNGSERSHNRYDERGNLLENIDALGRITKIMYDSNGLPEKVVAPDGSEKRFSHDDRGNITEIIDALGNVTRYSYDNLNRVIGVVEPSGAKRNFKYDVMDNIIEEINAEGNSRKYTYNENGKIIEVTDYDGNKISRSFNALGMPEVLTDKEGRQTKLQYDSMWNVARITRPDGGQTTYIYNENNRLTRIKDALGNTSRFTYDGMGNRLSIEDAEGAKVFFEYDALGRMIAAKDQEGYETRCEFNSDGNLVKVTDKNGNVLNRIVDEIGQVLEERLVSYDGIETIRKYSYDLLGNKISVETETGIVTKYKYLPGTDKLAEILYNDGTKVVCSYNANGYLQSKTHRNGVTLIYSYDSLNRLIEVKGPEGASKKYTYDVLGNVSSMIDARGNITKYEYSLSGKLIKVTDALGNFAEYTYDLNDRLVGINQHGSTEEPPRITKYKRNTLGQVETVIDSIGQEENYKYNKRGELIEKIDKDGYITKYGYTIRGDIESLQYADGREVMLSYDAMRRLTEVKDWLGITKITKDGLGRTIEVSYPDDKRVSYRYNSYNQRTEVTYPDGKQVRYAYDESSRLSELITRDNTSIKYLYNEYGLLSEKVFPNGIKTQYEYNNKGLISKLVHTDKEGVLDEYLYSYDATANKTGVIKNRRGLEESGSYSYEYDEIGRLCAVSKDEELLRKYSYDAFGNRILMEEMIGEKAGLTKYTYDALNQLIEKDRYSITDSLVDSETYEYDKRGNLTEVINNGQIKNKYVYGAINRLESAENSNKGIAKYIYDGLGHRVGKEEYLESAISEIDIPVPEKKINYLIDITREYNNLLEKEIEDIGEIETFIWDGNIAGRLKDDNYDFYLKDEMGSPIRFVDEEGIVEDSYGYDEFGNDLYDNQGASQPFGYTGYQMDNISGTYFAQAREYNPLTGRFEARDTVIGFTKLLCSQNRYTYCFNNALLLVDKNGKEPDDPDSDDGDITPGYTVSIETTEETAIWGGEYHTTTITEADKDHIIINTENGSVGSYGYYIGSYATFEDALIHLEGEIDAGADGIEGSVTLEVTIDGQRYVVTRTTDGWEFAYGDGTTVVGFGISLDNDITGDYKIYGFYETEINGYIYREEFGAKIKTWVLDLAAVVVAAIVLACIYCPVAIPEIAAFVAAIIEKISSSPCYI